MEVKYEIDDDEDEKALEDIVREHSGRDPIEIEGIGEIRMVRLNRRVRLEQEGKNREMKIGENDEIKKPQS